MLRTFLKADAVIQTFLLAEPRARKQLRHLEHSLASVISRVNSTNLVGWDEYMALWQVLKLQARYNSPLFASHGLDHSVRTVHYMMQLRQGLEFENVNTLLWTGLLHDVGYSEYDICESCQEMIESISPFVCKSGCNVPTGIAPDFYRKGKFLHARLGANMVETILSENPRLFAPEDKQLILSCIDQHNCDSHVKTTYNPRSHGVLLSIGKTSLERRYTTVELFSNPCLALLRIADNLDITRKRMLLEKKTETVVLYQKQVHEHGPTDWKPYLERCPSSVDAGMVLKILEHTTRQEFKYTYSLWIIEELQVERVDWSLPAFDIVVRTFQTQEQSLQRENNPVLALYQFQRMWEAFGSIYVRETCLVDIIRVQIDDSEYKTLEELLRD